MSELKPCPFCGNIYGDGGIQNNKLYWLCSRCGARLPKNNGWKILDEVTDTYHPLDWNTRAIDPRLKKAVEEIETMGRNCMKGDVRKDGLLLASYIFEKHFPELKEAKDE